MRSRTLMTQNQVLQFCSEQQAGFQPGFQGEGSKSQADCRDEDSLPRAFPGESEIQKELLMCLLYRTQIFRDRFSAKLVKRKKCAAVGDRSEGRLIKSRL